VGRPDLIFEDRIGRLLVIELKRDTLERGGVLQLVDYFGMLKTQFPDRAVELMIVASRIPQERRVACEQYNIDAREIAQERFRDVAEEVGYAFKSEQPKTAEPEPVIPHESPAPKSNQVALSSTPEFSGGPKIEKGWYFWKGSNGRNYFLACGNAKGSCSIRRFESEHGIAQGKEYKSSDFQVAFSDYLRTAVPLHVSGQPNLERDCKDRLPDNVLAELKIQLQR
jgi:hypothetical protein